MVSLMAFPSSGDCYSDLFYRAVKAAGVDVRSGQFSGKWLWKHLRNIDYVHLHWPSFFYSYKQPIRCLYAFALFLFFLALARWRGARILWTVHNLYPHDPCIIPQLDKLGRWALVKMCARFYIHGPSAEEQVLRAFPGMAGRTVLIDYGHWKGYYPESITRSEARQRLGLAEEDFVFLFIGLCKPYKNVDGLIRTFTTMPGKPMLIIAGKFQDPAYESLVREEIARSSARIVLHAGIVPDENMQVYLKACEVVVVPYGDLLTSGVAMLAVSFGRPVVGPRALTDTVAEGCGVLYDGSWSDGLLQALQAAMSRKFDESYILSRATAKDWDESARRFIDGLPVVPATGTRATEIDPAA
jgi:beta-1,4-mannosyltransferase